MCINMTGDQERALIDATQQLITADSSDSNNVTTLYVRCHCQVCRKEFLGLSGALTCSKLCDKQWMERNIFSKLELAQQLQKEVKK